MRIRLTTQADLPFLDALFDGCRAYMAAEGNPTQWNETYPTAKLVAQDITAGTGYVCANDHDEVIGSFALTSYEEQYDKLYDGKWHYDEPYVVVHRMGTLPRQGAGRFIFTELMAKHPYIRVDTHEANITMRRLLSSLGFAYCGKVTYEGWGERVCYDWHQ